MLRLLDHDFVEAGLFGRELGVHVFERLAEQVAHDQVAVPLAVGRHDVPGGVLGVAAR